MSVESGDNTEFERMRMRVGEVVANGQVMRPGRPIVGREWYVHGNLGSDSSGDGLSWTKPLATFARVVALGLASGDVVYLAGNIAEQVVTPAGVFDVAMIGMGFGNPRHPDSHTTNGGWRSATRWKEPATGATSAALLRVQQQGWYFENILFTPGATATIALEGYTDVASGDSERDASHMVVNRCRFSGAGTGIRWNGLPNFMSVLNSRFDNLTTAIANTVGAGAKTNSWHRYEGNWFVTNTNHLVVPLQDGLVLRNMFGGAPTKGLDLTNGGGRNVVTENVFMGTYDSAYVAVSTDFWFNNHSITTGSGEVDADGKTSSIPVA